MWITTRTAVLAAVSTAACGGNEDAAAPRPSMIERQKQTVAAAWAAMNAHEARKYSELFAPDAVVREYGLGEAKGREAIAAGIQGAFIGFPDYRIGVSRVFVKEDVLVQEWVITGTNEGEFNGAKPTGKVIGIRGASVLAFTPGGLIKTEQRYFDTSTVASQLGLTKSSVRPVEPLPRGEPEWRIARGTAEEDELVEVAEMISGTFERRSQSDFLGVLSDVVVCSNLAEAKDMTGRTSAQQFFGMFTNAFPDAKVSSVFGVDNVVVSEWSMTATHAGLLGALPATNKQVTLHGLTIMVLEAGKVTSASSYWNSFELLGPPSAEP